MTFCKLRLWALSAILVVFIPAVQSIPAPTVLEGGVIVEGGAIIES